MSFSSPAAARDSTSSIRPAKRWSATRFGITSPFGGTKQSGLGYRNGEEGYKEYLELKTIGMPE